MIRRITSALAAAALTAGFAGSIPVSANFTTSGAEKDIKDMTTMEIVNDMGIGINLGNTFESCGDWIRGTEVSDYETAWGSDPIQRETIDGYAAEGFGVLRIPVAWSNMMDADYNIDQRYIDRVKEVTQWALDADLYVIVNLHWDGGWLNKFPLNEEESMKKYTAIWTQLCDNFEEFDERVMFESLNEELGAWTDAGMWNPYDSWNTEGKEEVYELANKINQKFVDIVRGSGGNNAKRHLLIAGICTNISMTSDELYKMPNDHANRCALSLHYYDPFSFSHDNSPNWGSIADYKLLNDNMNIVKENFIDKGIPVIMGECGFGGEINKKAEGAAHEYLTAVCDAMYSRGICPVIWDVDWDDPDQDNSVYNRKECKLTDPTLKADLQKIVENGLKIEVELSGDDTYETCYKYPAFELGITSTGSGRLQYISSNEDVATIDENGVVTPLGLGSTTITIYSPATDTELAAFKTVKVKVDRNPTPPNPPESKMVVDSSVVSTDDIPLPEGWSWNEVYIIPETGSIIAKAVYDDKNYSNRIVEVEISRAPVNTPEDPSSDPKEDDPNSDPSSDSKDSTTSNNNSNSGSSNGKDNDPSPATGAGAGIAGAVTLLAALIAVKKKNG